MRRTDFPPVLLQLAGWAAAGAAAAMSVALVAGAAYGLDIWIQMPNLLSSTNGALTTPLLLTWAVLLLAATAATATTNRAALRGLRALRTPVATAP